MNEHLSPRQIEDWIIGLRPTDAQEHLDTCQACAGELERTLEPLELFGSAMRNWSAEMGSSGPGMSFAIRNASSGWRGIWRQRMVRATFVAASLVAVIGVPVYRQERMKRQAAEIAIQDEVLLRQVQSGISRSVPAPMEPLAQLLSSDTGR